MDPTEKKKLYVEGNSFDWTKVPAVLRKELESLAQSMNQDAMTILLSLLTVFSACIGHTQVVISNKWKENTLIWAMICAESGRGKSVVYAFAKSIIEKVKTNVHYNEERKGRDITVPNTTWDKLGDIMANNGARIYGMFDEVMGFFSQHGIYTNRTKITECKELRDLLRLYNCDDLRRETVTGNANYKMTLSQFTILGLTQPDSAIALMKDENGQRSGFPFRFIWYFPEPKFSSLADLLSPDPIDQEVFESALVKYLTLKYERSDENCTYTTEDKVLSVRPTLEQYTLSPTALEMFREFHDHVELGILKKYLFNLIISGAYSKAKGMALRVALVVQHLLNFINEYKQNTKDHGGENSQEAPSEMSDHGGENSREAPSEMSDADDNEIGVDALNIAISIVQLSLNQTCLINFGDMLGNANSIPTNLQYSLDIELMRKLLLINSSIISMSVLINDHFARPNIKTINKKAVETEGAALMRVFRKLNDLKLGRFVQLKGSKNHRPVYFFKKKENVCEETKNENLENLGISAEDFAAHEEAHEQLNDDEEEHRKAYVAKEKWVESDFTPEDIIQATPSTPKKRKNSGGDPIAEKKKHVEDSEDKD